MAAALAWRDDIAAHWDDDGQVKWLEGAGGVLVRGHGPAWWASGASTSSSPDGSVRELEATRAVVFATGSSAKMPPIDGLR